MPDPATIDQQLEEEQKSDLMKRMANVMGSIDDELEAFHKNYIRNDFNASSIATSTNKLLSELLNSYKKVNKENVIKDELIPAIALYSNQFKETTKAAALKSIAATGRLVEAINDRFSERLMFDKDSRKEDIKHRAELRHDSSVQRKIDGRALANEEDKRDEVLEARANRLESLLTQIIANTKQKQMVVTGRQGGGGGGFGSGLVAGAAAGGVWAFVKKGAAGVWNFMKAGVTGVWNFMKAGGTKLWTAIAAGGKKVWTFLGSGFKKILGGIRGLLGRFAPILARVGAAAMAGLGTIGKGAVKMLGPAAAVAAAAAAGWQVGTWIDEKFGVSDKISDWLSGPNASEIAAQQIEQKSLDKQGEANVVKTKAQTTVMKEVGLSTKEMDALKSAKDAEGFLNLSEAHQDLIIKAKQAQVLEQKERVRRAGAEEAQAVTDAGMFISSADQAVINQKEAESAAFKKGMRTQNEQLNKLLRLRKESSESRKSAGVIEKEIIDRAVPVLKASTVAKPQDEKELKKAAEENAKLVEKSVEFQESTDKHGGETVDELATMNEKMDKLINAVNNSQGQTVTREIGPLKPKKDTL